MADGARAGDGMAAQSIFLSHIKDSGPALVVRLYTLPIPQCVICRESYNYHNIICGLPFYF